MTNKTDIVERLRAEIERLRQTLLKISCPHVTQGRLWWQDEARAALAEKEGGE